MISWKRNDFHYCYPLVLAPSIIGYSNTIELFLIDTANNLPQSLVLCRDIRITRENDFTLVTHATNIFRVNLYGWPRVQMFIKQYSNLKLV